MTCKNCGNILSENEQFCPNCGTEKSEYKGTKDTNDKSPKKGKFALPKKNVVYPWRNSSSCDHCHYIDFIPPTFH